MLSDLRTNIAVFRYSQVFPLLGVTRDARKHVGKAAFLAREAIRIETTQSGLVIWGDLCVLAVWRARRESDVSATTQPPPQYLTPPSNPLIYPPWLNPSIKVPNAL